MSCQYLLNMNVGDHTWNYILIKFIMDKLYSNLDFEGGSVMLKSMGIKGLGVLITFLLIGAGG